MSLTAIEGTCPEVYDCECEDPNHDHSKPYECGADLYEDDDQREKHYEVRCSLGHVLSEYQANVPW